VFVCSYVIVVAFDELADLLRICGGLEVVELIGPGICVSMDVLDDRLPSCWGPLLVKLGVPGWDTLCLWIYLALEWSVVNLFFDFGL
jgi:hypothetical protein